VYCFSLASPNSLELRLAVGGCGSKIRCNSSDFVQRRSGSQADQGRSWGRACAREIWFSSSQLRVCALSRNNSQAASHTTAINCLVSSAVGGTVEAIAVVSSRTDAQKASLRSTASLITWSLAVCFASALSCFTLSFHLCFDSRRLACVVGLTLAWASSSPPLASSGKNLGSRSP
jgi:hypothetical protein